MKIFQTTQEYMKYGGLIKDRGAFNPIQIWTFFKSIAFLVLQLVYLDREAETPRQYMDSIFITSAGALIFISYADIAVKNDVIFNLIDEMEKVINERLRCSELKTMYKKTIQSVERNSKIIQFLVVYVSVPGFVLPKAAFSYFKFYTTDLGPDAFEMPVSTWMPFDWRNPLGFSFAIALQLAMASFTLRYMSYMASLGIGLYLFGLLFTKGLRDRLIAFNEMIRNQTSRCQLMDYLCETVRFSYMKRFAFSFINIYQTTLAVLFVGCIACICLVMLMIQLQISTRTIDAVMLFESMFYGFWASMLVFCTCEVSEHFSGEYNEIFDKTMELDWYLLPIEMQRMLVIIMIPAQKPLVIQFFGSISCGRELFKQVMVKCYNSFMVFREVL